MAAYEARDRASKDEVAFAQDYRNTWYWLAFFVAMMIFALLHLGSPDRVEFFWSPILAVIAAVGIAGCTYQLAVRRGRGLFLNRDGFRICTAWRTRRFRWTEVGAFYVSADSDGAKSVGFSTHGSRRPPQNPFAKAARWLSHTTLPGTYGMSAEALADLMNEWRVRHGGARIALRS